MICEIMLFDLASSESSTWTSVRVTPREKKSNCRLALIDATNVIRGTCLTFVHNNYYKFVLLPFEARKFVEAILILLT